MPSQIVSFPFFKIQSENTDDKEYGTERIYRNAAELIGWTPLVETKRISKKEGAQARIVAKLEGYQPGGSVKDRMALAMILDAESKGFIVPNVSTIVEPTSGNTGISLAVVALQRGYKVVAVMPYIYSMERRMVLRALGARVVLTGPDIAAVLGKCKELVTSIPNAYILDQTSNPMNPSAHYHSTGPEIWKDTAGKVDIFVAGVGTGGTLSGTAKYLKEKNPNVQIVAVEPVESAVLSGGMKGLHGIQGIGTGIIQSVTDTSLIDQVVTVSTEESYAYTRSLMQEEGLLVGISSGAAFAGALKVARAPENKGKLVVAMFPSAAERYLTTSLFASIKKECETMTIS